MQKFKPGDRVIFLNEKGGGVVTKVIDDQIVHVAIAEGFEIPYSTGDLLREGVGDDDLPLTGRRAGRKGSDREGREVLFSIPNKVDQRPEGIYLAMVPTDQDKVLESRLELQLLNHSPYGVSFGILLNQSGKYSGFAHGQMDADTSLVLAKVGRNEIGDWANGLVQLLFYQDGNTRPLSPASATIGFRPVKVYKEDSFPYEGLLRKKAFVIELATISAQAQVLMKDDNLEADLRQLQEQTSEGSRKPRPAEGKEGMMDKHKVDDQIAEVDLHIGELTDNLTGLSNADMLRVQMDYFRRCMEQAWKERLKKIIFIHGVGNGTLKMELLRSLRQTEGIEFYDAPYARYGMGATEVVFYRHR
jgi:hypothetical protein